MTDTKTGEPRYNAAFPAVAACLEKIGATDFNQAFIDLATGALDADQCMIFSYEAEKPRCFLSYNTRPLGEASALSDKYVIYGHKQDPVREIIQDESSEAIRILQLDDLKTRMSAEYMQEFFSAPGLVDKIAVIARKENLALCLNFYRHKGSGQYGKTFLEQAVPLLRIAAHLALLHYQSSTDHSLEDPLLTLSEREQEVCRWILKGLTTEAIAFEMNVSPNTISTFRKRAYEKLSINSKPALFALCRA